MATKDLKFVREAASGGFEEVNLTIGASKLLATNASCDLELVDKSAYTGGGGGSGGTAQGVYETYDLVTNNYKLGYGSGPITVGEYSVNLQSYIDSNIQSASADCSVAIGVTNVASGLWSTAIGQSNTASGAVSLAMGSTTYASAACATALGHNASARASAATAVGHLACACGVDSLGLGKKSCGGGDNSAGIGFCAYATATASTAVGASSCATANTASAFGYTAKATGVGSLALQFGQARGVCSIAIGYNAIACTSSTRAIAIGGVADGVNAIAIGNGASATANQFAVCATAGFVLKDGSQSDGYVMTWCAADGAGRWKPAGGGGGGGGTSVTCYSGATDCSLTITGSSGAAPPTEACACGVDLLVRRINSTPHGKAAVAIGSHGAGANYSIGGYAVFIGSGDGESSGYYSIAIGSDAVAKGGAVAIGRTVSSQYCSVVIGRKNDAAPGGYSAGNTIIGGYQNCIDAVGYYSTSYNTIIGGVCSCVTCGNNNAVFNGFNAVLNTDYSYAMVTTGRTVAVASCTLHAKCLNLDSLPTAATGLPSGSVWYDSTTCILMIVP